jgi:hypothetical protein
MMLAELVIPGAWGGWSLVLILVLVWLLLAYLYRGVALGNWKWVCVTCKALAIGVLVFALFEPIWAGRRVRPGANVMAVVVDNGEGLRVRDRGESRTRSELVQSWLEPVAGGWLEALGENFDLRRYKVDRGAVRVRDFDRLDFRGRASGLYGGVKDVAGRLSGSPLAGVILLTDGNATDSPRLLEGVEGLPPVYPVVVGRSGAVKDLSVGELQVSETAFEDAPVRVSGRVLASGFGSGSVDLRLVDREGALLAEERLRLRGGKEELPFDLRFRGQASGTGFYRVEVSGGAGGKGVGGDDGSGEATLVNNVRSFTVEHGEGVHRVLYVSGRPNWEFKYLNRGIQEDDQVQLVGLIRVAMREPRFDFRGRGGESSNPLFRGFGEQSEEEIERYDQPVLIRVYTRDEQELQKGFPLTPEELFEYEAVILDDLEAGFFSSVQANLLRRFVSERGGGLMMLGGAESFREGGYGGSAIGDTLPVYLDRVVRPPDGGELRWELTREGWLLPWARMGEDEVQERARLATVGGYSVVNWVGGVKPGASMVFGLRALDGELYPALVSQRYGRGRSLALLVGDLWRWGLREKEYMGQMGRAWRQWVRWLVADVPRRAELVAVEDPGEGSAVLLRAVVRDAAFEPVDDATVEFEVERVDWAGETNSEPVVAMRLRGEPSGEESGVYETTVVPSRSGAYRVTGRVINAAGAEIHRVGAGWVADLGVEEFRSLEPDFEAMGRLAAMTGGRVVEASELESFARGLASVDAPVMETWTKPAWHTPWLFAVALGFFVTEWWIRRWKGLA